MNLKDIVQYNPADRQPSVSGEKIPWNDPEFSKRMLANHLSQDHDWASRRHSIIERHVAWIDAWLKKHVPAAPARILDLACGPGLYAHMLAERGYVCTGVDFSPASIDHARNRAAANGLDVTYVLEDIRAYRNTGTFDCVLLTFGEINVFTAKDAAALLASAHAMTREGGLFLLEAHTLEAVRDAGMAAPSWQRQENGLFSERPHLLLEEHAWNEASALASTRYYVIDAETGGVTPYASAMQGYAAEEYERMLLHAGFQRSRTLEAGEWPAGEYFQSRLVTFICQK